MRIAYTDEQEALRDELNAYYERLLTDEIREQLTVEHGVGPVTRQVVKQMAADGWLGIGWPEEYGGQGRGQIEQFIFFDESMRSGAPVPMLTINTVGPTIMANGTEEQKELLPPEDPRRRPRTSRSATPSPRPAPTWPSLKTRAVRDGDEYVVNGQKMWTSLASDADYCWLAVRTDPEAPKHKGISMLIVDLKNTAGITIEPLHLLSSHDINAVYYDNVRVPADNLVGGENNGWSLIVNQLNHERVTLCSAGPARAELPGDAEVRPRHQDRRRPRSSTSSGCSSTWPGCAPGSTSCASSTGRSRGPRPRATWTSPTRRPSRCSAPSSTSSRSGSSWRSSARGPTCDRKSPESLLQGRLEMNYRSLVILTFGGGTNEIQRDLIAMFGLGLPRALRG